jgi:hypothetical protein
MPKVGKKEIPIQLNYESKNISNQKINQELFKNSGYRQRDKTKAIGYGP